MAASPPAPGELALVQACADPECRTVSFDTISKGPMVYLTLRRSHARPEPPPLAPAPLKPAPLPRHGRSHRIIDICSLSSTDRAS